MYIFTNDYQFSVRNLVDIKEAYLIFRALNNKPRQAILKLLEKQGKLAVSEISIVLRIEQSAASQHLAILRRASILKTVRQGKYIYYDLHTAQLGKIEYCIRQLLA